MADFWTRAGQVQQERIERRVDNVLRNGLADMEKCNAFLSLIARDKPAPMQWYLDQLGDA